MTLSPSQIGDLLEADIRRATRSMELERLQRELETDVAIDLMLANAHLDGISMRPLMQGIDTMPDALNDPRLPRINWGE